MSGKLSICAALYEVRYLYIDMGCYCGYNAMVLAFYFVLYNTTYNPANTIFHYKSGASYSAYLNYMFLLQCVSFYLYEEGFFSLYEDYLDKIKPIVEDVFICRIQMAMGNAPGKEIIT